MDETNAAGQEVRGKLQAMQSAIDSLGSSGNSELRIRQTVQFTLDKKFMDFLSECVGCNRNLFIPQFFFVSPQSLAPLQWAACCLGSCCAQVHADAGTDPNSERPGCNKGIHSSVT